MACFSNMTLEGMGWMGSVWGEVSDVNSVAAIPSLEKTVDEGAIVCAL